MRYCPECESYRNHPSRAGHLTEKIFNLLTLRRLYRCEDCAAIFLDYIISRDQPRPIKDKEAESGPHS
jgi:hypothetical protein